MIVNVTQTGVVTAVDFVDLSERWNFAPAPGSHQDIGLLDPSGDGPLGLVDMVHDDPAGVWVAQSDGGLVNLDPNTGRVRWRLDVPGRAEGVRGAPGRPWFVWSSFTSEGDNRAPAVLRVDPISGEELWRAEGRIGADWGWNPLAMTDDQVFMADVFADPESSADGEGSVIHAYDIDNGDVDFTVSVDAPAGVWSDTALLNILTLDDEPILLSTTTHGLLTRIDLPGGDVRWSRPVNPGVLLGAAQTVDGTWTMRVRTSPFGPYYLDLDDGSRLGDVRLESPPEGCETQYGPTAWLVWWPVDEAAERTDCIVVAETQVLQIFNRGFEPMTLSWSGRREEVVSDDFIELMSTGRRLSVGPNHIDVDPYPDLLVWVMAPESAPTAGLRRTDSSYGPIEFGMTVADASAALGPDLKLVPLDSERTCAAVGGDPYSPLFRTGPSAEGPIIVGVGEPGAAGTGDRLCG